MMMRPEQSRAARALLDMTTREVGEATGISATAISRFEKYGTSHARTVYRIHDYYVRRGIKFEDNPADGYGALYHPGYDNELPAKMKARLTFSGYIESRDLTDGPAGDFVRDVQQDPAFPDAVSWTEVEMYLSRRGADAAAVTAAKALWEEFERQRGLAPAVRTESRG